MLTLLPHFILRFENVLVVLNMFPQLFDAKGADFSEQSGHLQRKMLQLSHIYLYARLLLLVYFKIWLCFLLDRLLSHRLP